MKRKALGRGLSALIPETGGAVASARVTSSSAPSRRSSPPRTNHGSSSTSSGWRSSWPPSVSRAWSSRWWCGPARSGTYTLMVGERRWRAAQKAGVHEVPVVIRKVDDLQAFELALVENLQRADLNPIEEAEAYQRLLEEHGYTQEQLAKRLGTRPLHRGQQPAPAQAPAAGSTAVPARRGLSPGHARALLPPGAGPRHQQGRIARWSSTSSRCARPSCWSSGCSTRWRRKKPVRRLRKRARSTAQAEPAR